MSSQNTNNTSFDALHLQSLMRRLNLHPPYLNTNSYLSVPLNDLLEFDQQQQTRIHLIREESKIEKEIIRIIQTGNIETLKPNTSEAVTVCGEHHVCVGYSEEADSDCRAWEWHGHIMTFDGEKGYSPEYIHGIYFERMKKRVDRRSNEVEEMGVEDLGLRELISDGDSFDVVSFARV